MAIVKANYCKRGPTTPAAAKRAARYYTFREGPDRSTRQWYGPDGQTVPYETVQAAVAEHAQTYAYTYRVVLSTKDRDLGPDGYRQALAEQFDRYYLIEHHNTSYPHAHVIGFRHQLARKGDLMALRDRVVTLEQTPSQQRAQEATRTPQEATRTDPPHQRRHAQSLDLERD